MERQSSATAFVDADKILSVARGGVDVTHHEALQGIDANGTIKVVDIYRQLVGSAHKTVPFCSQARLIDKGLGSKWKSLAAK